MICQPPLGAALGALHARVEADPLAQREGVGVVAQPLEDVRVMRVVGVAIGHREVAKGDRRLGDVDVQRAVRRGDPVGVLEVPVAAHFVRGLKAGVGHAEVRERLARGEPADAGSDHAHRGKLAHVADPKGHTSASRASLTRLFGGLYVVRMVERAAVPKVSALRHGAMRLARALTTPLLPDDYLALLNPAWSARELTGTIVRRSSPETATPRRSSCGRTFAGRAIGRASTCGIGAELNGIRHWRAYSLTSDPDHPDGLVSITVKHVAERQDVAVLHAPGRAGRRWSSSARSRASSGFPTRLPSERSSSARAAV